MLISLLRHAGEVDGDRGQPAHPLAGRGRHRRIAAPAAEHLAFGARRLERFRAGDRFDQHRMLQAGVGLRVERGAAHRLLQAEAGDQHQQMPAIGTSTSQPASDRDQPEEQDEEGDIDGQDDRGRGEEVAHHLDIRKRAGQTRRCCPGARPSAGSSLSRTASATAWRRACGRPRRSAATRATRRMKSNASARSTPSASTHKVDTALFGMTRS